MALIVATQLKALAESIVPAAPPTASAEQLAARNAAVANTEDLVTKVCQYLVAQLEIKGVKTNLDTGPRTIETYAAGVGDHGGALNSATGGPVTGNVKDAKASVATQNNDGKGRVL